MSCGSECEGFGREVAVGVFVQIDAEEVGREPLLAYVEFVGDELLRCVRFFGVDAVLDEVEADLAEGLVGGGSVRRRGAGRELAHLAAYAAFA